MARRLQHAFPGRSKGLRTLVTGVAVAALLSGTIPAGASTAKDDARFRIELTAYLSQMERVDAFLRSHQTTSGLLTDANGGSAIRAAIKLVPSMSHAEISALEQAFASQPGWQQGPSNLLGILGAGSARPKEGAGVVGGPSFSLTKDCDPGIGADPPPGGLSRADIHIAEGVQLAAEVAVGISDVLLPDTADAITAGLWGVYAAAAAATLVVAGIYDTADECQSIQLDAYIRSMGGAGSAPFQALVTLPDLKLLFQGVDTKVTNIQTTVNNIQTTVNNVQTTVGDIQTTVGDIQTTVGDIQTAVVALQGSVSAEAERNLRLRIEEALSDPSMQAVISFELPNAFGGYLEKVKQVVTDAITNAGNAGLAVATAKSFLTQANNYFNAGNWKSAYATYGKAYRATG